MTIIFPADSGSIRKRWLVVVALTLAAAAVRAIWIDHPLLWMDELFTWVYTRESFAHHFALDRTSDIHPPLHPVMLKSWISCFGDSRTAMRSLSILFGSLTLPALYLIAYRWLNARIAVISSIFFALNPISIHYSREVRPYAALSFFLLWAIYFFLEIVRARAEHNRVGWLIAGFAICLAMTFHLHYTSVMFFPLFGLAALLLGIPERDWRLIALLAGGICAAVILCLPQSVHFLGYAIHEGSSRNEWMLPTSWQVFYSQTAGAYPFPSFTKLLVAPLFVFGGWSLWRLSRQLFTIVAIFVIAGPLLFAAVGFVRPLYLVRSIQCFTLLSPLLLGAALSAFRGPALAAGMAVYGAIHLWAASPDYPLKRLGNIGEVLSSALPGRDDGAVFFDANLTLELKAYHLESQNWRPLDLMNSARDGAGIARYLSDCAARQRTCKSTAVVIEHEPLVEKDAGAAWNKILDDLTRTYPPMSDVVISNYRIVTFRPM